MTPTQTDKLTETIYNCLHSHNEADRNGEIANVVDGLFAISRAIRFLAEAIRTVPKKET